MTKLDWERLQRKDKASKERELPSHISGVSIPRKSARKRVDRNGPKPSPIIPQGHGIGECHFCARYFQNFIEHEEVCDKNPAVRARKRKAKLKKAAHKKKLANRTKAKPAKKRASNKVKKARKSTVRGHSPISTTKPTIIIKKSKALGPRK